MKYSLANIWLFLILFTLISCNEQGVEESSRDDDSSPTVTTPAPDPSLEPTPNPPIEETPKVSYRHDSQREAILEEIENFEFIQNKILKGIIKKEIESFFSVFMENENENDFNQDEEDDDFPNQEDLNKLFILMLSNEEEITADDDFQHFKYTPTENVCRDILAKNNPAVCIEAMKKIDFRLVIKDDANSSLTINYNNTPIMDINFNNQGRNYEVNVAAIGNVLRDINSLNQSLSPEDYELNPPILQGGFTLNRNQVEKEIKYQLHISSDIYINNHIENNMYDFLYIERAEDFLDLSLNKNESKLSIKINSGLVYLNEIKEFNSLNSNFSTYFTDLTGAILIDNKNAIIQFANFFTSSFYNTFNNITDSIISFSSLTGALKFGETMILSLENKGYFSLDLKDTPRNERAGIMNFTYFGPFRMKLSRHDVGQNNWLPLFIIQEGSLMIEGYNDFAGALSVDQGSCFTIDEPNNLELPFRPMNCL